MDNYILWLVSWYPNSLAPFDGDFIQRHAKAVSLFQKIVVIYFKKDEHGVITTDVKEMTSITENLTEKIIYYHSLKTGIIIIDRFLSNLKYKNVYQKYLSKYLQQEGKPLLTHVHVAIKAGEQALWLQTKFNIPFIISEHWTGYLPEAQLKFRNLHRYNRINITKAFAVAKKITAVSEVLGQAIQKLFFIKDYLVIPNVVDTTIFYPKDHPKNSPPIFIHISNMNYQKNGGAIIEAFNLLKKRGYDFQLLIFGNVPDKYFILVKDLNLEHQILFKKEVPQNELANTLKISDALILYSRYETFGCVVIEANACEVPVILSDLPVFKEFVTEGENGHFVAKDNSADLASAIENFIGGKFQFNKKKISERISYRFCFEAIGIKFYDLYRQILSESKDELL